jgi:hypothetical protein
VEESRFFCPRVKTGAECSSECGNEPSGSIKCRETTEWLHIWWRAQVHRVSHIACATAKGRTTRRDTSGMVGLSRRCSLCCVCVSVFESCSALYRLTGQEVKPPTLKISPLVIFINQLGPGVISLCGNDNRSLSISLVCCCLPKGSWSPAGDNDCISGRAWIDAFCLALC